MSLKKPQNLLIIGAVVAALLAGTILLGGYANILPTGSDNGSQAEAAPATGQKSCPMAKAHLAEAGDVKAGCPRKAAGGFDAKTCPLGRTEPCCADECCKDCCPAKCCPDKCCEACCPAECCPDKCCEDCCPENAEGCCPAEAKPCCP